MSVTGKILEVSLPATDLDSQALVITIPREYKRIFSAQSTIHSDVKYTHFRGEVSQI